MTILIALCVGFVLDLLIGDPLWLPHPVQGIGWLIARLEVPLRRVFPKSPGGELVAGGVMVVLVCLSGFLVPFALLWAAGLWSPYARLALECILCWQVLATKSLRDAAMQVYHPLAAGNLEAARKAVAGIVGRDTEALDAPGVARATVETVAENTGDGIVAPMLFFAIGGAPLALLYKAINTMDSMVGYKNSRFIYFGRAAARLDDLANYVPARLAGFLSVAAAGFCRLNAGGALRILRRDRKNHTSPNAGWPEAACAGALGVRLGGSSSYGGVMVEKPTIGDETRRIAPDDIRKACRLSFAVAVLCLTLCAAVRLAFVLPTLTF
ncbi:adenosylcobinamide-phosphate synthase CbiB [Ruminococcaceae bacterium OttesenSCG-928-D13]|nr:adenosylcobinamide-phosphate synthase CbiB [Ruminococcaceae bacterium OttesenSCG-928-D13]